MSEKSFEIQRLTQYKNGEASTGVVGYVDPAIRNFRNYPNDVLYTGFKIFFHFGATSGLFASDMYVNSALAYLNRIGETHRYELLKILISTLSNINTNNSWVFREVTNLSEIYSRDYGSPVIGGDFSVTTLETIDFKVNSIGNMYRKIAYDRDRRVWVLPPNLRKFSMSIYIYDPRIFLDTSVNNANNLQTPTNAGKVDQLNHVMFDFGHCELMPSTGNMLFDGLSNIASGAPVGSNLDIKFGTYDVNSLFKSITGDTQLSTSTLNNKNESVNTTDEIKDAQGNKFIDKIKNSSLFQKVENNLLLNKIQDDLSLLTDQDEWKTNAKAFGEDKQKELETRANNIVNDRLTTELAKLYLGNASGLSVTDIKNYFNSGGKSQDAINNLSRRSKEFPSLGDLGNTIGQ